MPDWLPSLIQGGAGLLGAGINYFSQQSANEANMQLAREQRDFYLEQWKRENAYNDPSAQMARLQRAGLNPSLMYGEGSAGMPASASMADVEAARVSASQVDPYLLAQIANINADTRNKDINSDKQSSDIKVNEGLIKVNESVVLYNKALTSMTKAQQDNIVAHTEALATTVSLQNSEIAKNFASIEKMKTDVYQRSVELALKSKEVDSIVDKYAAEASMTREQLKYVSVLAMAKVRNLNADTLLKHANIEVAHEESQRLHKLVENLSIQNGQLAWDLKMSYSYDETDRQLSQAEALSRVIAAICGQTAESIATSPIRAAEYNDYGKKLNLNIPTDGSGFN